ncbi:hypothetical protein BCR35DRAFT_324803 [Leucosporidium creatinivorum]|uniref:G-patch domain-containing protein n=1 Tax=Leucosporidium creatinivorum TaxID=106004 RepID=A0A1Y2FJJ1_9BASI|nr:hypothetical protein BCR35DRAFT_324803 [Leucosporidium creatinivorum]
MSRRDDYRHPPPARDDRNSWDSRQGYDDGRGGRGGGRDDWAGRGDREYRDYDRPRGGGGAGGGRGRDWDEGGGYGSKRGRYDDYNAPYGGRDDHRPPAQYDQQYPPAPQQQQHPDPSYGAQVAYGQPSYPQLPPFQPAPSHDQPPGEGSTLRGRPAPTAPEAPSASVVLLGLPAHVTDVTLRHFLEDMGASIDSTTVIIDRATGLSKRYGFAKFSSVEHARAFVEPNFPTVSWKERVGISPEDGMKIKINYSQKSGGWREDQGATARMTEDQRKAAEAGSAPQSFYVNDGTRDIGSAPTQILLLRNLDPLTPEDEIITALSGLGGRAGNEIRSGGVKKIMITRDRASRGSWGFAFVQFADVRLATEVLATAFNARQYPQGFRIRNSVVAFSFCHENSFVPIYARSEFSFKGEGGQQLAYWDDKAFVSVWVPPQVAKAAAAAAKAAKTTSSAEDDMEAFFSSLEAEAPHIAAEGAPAPVAPPLPTLAGFAPIALKSSTAAALAGAPKEDESKSAVKPKPAAAPHAPIVGPGSAAAAAVVATPLLPEKKKGADLIVSRKAAPNISKWNTKQAELKQPDPAPAPPKAVTSSANTTPVASAPPSSQPPSASTSAADEFEHGDPISMICLLCQRQFKKVEELKKHNKLSALHKTNLANPTTVADSAARKAASVAKHAAAAASTSTSTSTSTSNGPQYVDRAAARREALGQPDHPVHQKKRKFEGPAPPAPKVEQPNRANVEIEESNVGSKMLEKMGWSKGVGLGADGSGRVAPIAAAQFAQGAGLGSTKGVRVGEFDSTPKGYAESLREKARARMAESEAPNRKDGA